MELSLRPTSPDFLDLPWQLPLSEWRGACPRLEELPHGLSRHPVVFVNYNASLYALKELPADLAEKEYNLLCKMEELRLPAVTPIGHTHTHTHQGSASVLITRYLDRSLPYRSLFMGAGLGRYREGLLDAIAGLLVQLHLCGVYWGDCSLSNTLFRRDAGALQAYLVDAETAETYSNRLAPALRLRDLQIMEENVNGDLADLESEHLLTQDIPIEDTGAYIRLTYRRLWDEITHADIIQPDERYRIQERINALNALGFSVKEVELTKVANGALANGEVEGGEVLSLRVVVADRNFHSNQLHSVTGLEVEERQARQLMNEILEHKATLSKAQDRSTPLSVAAYHWLENIYQPTVHILKPMLDVCTSPAELYCQVLEHKWYMSERARRDVGHLPAAEEFLRLYGPPCG